MKPITSRDFSDRSDLRIYQYGMEKCQPGHAYGPSVRDHFLIHFILQGEGTFQSEGQTRKLSAGQGFLICPDQITYYQADAVNPWHYAWIGFGGTKAASYLSRAGLSASSPIIGVPQAAANPATRAIFESLAAAQHMKKGRNIHLLGLLYLFLAELIEQAHPPQAGEDQLARQEWYVQQAVDYLAMNYFRKISISSLSRQIGLDRSYFGALFRQLTGLSPQQYLLRLRMEKAASLIKRSTMPISSIAKSVGYDDPLLFSRMFRKLWGQSPSGFRLAVRQIQDQDQDARLGASE